MSGTTALEDILGLPTVELALLGENGNAWAILARFKDAARRTEGWTNEDIDYVTSLAMNGTYENLLWVMMQVTIDPNEDTDDEDGW